MDCLSAAAADVDHPTGGLKDMVGVLESESQECNGGNVMVMENPLYFSYFPSISCYAVCVIRSLAAHTQV